MEFIKDWLFGQGIILLYGLALLAAMVVSTTIWQILERVEDSKLGIPVRSVICIPAIVIGWLSIGGVIGLILRDLPILSIMIKILFEGMWISIVAFKAIPRNGRFVTVILLVLYVIYYGILAWIHYSESGWEYFLTFNGIMIPVAVASAVSFYFFYKKFRDDIDRNNGDLE